MPALPFSSGLTANQLGYNPLTDWQFENVPIAWPAGAVVSVMIRATTAAVKMQVSSGSQTIQERAPVQSGGTAGVTPSELNTAPLTFLAQQGDRIKLSIDETGGAVATVDGIVQIEPA